MIDSEKPIEEHLHDERVKQLERINKEKGEKYVEDQARLLDEVPHEFHGPLSMMAWDRGHSAGYDEVIMILDSLIHDLKPAIEAYRRRILGVK